MIHVIQKSQQFHGHQERTEQLMILNITYNGQSANHELQIEMQNVNDEDIRRIASEIMGFQNNQFENYVVDRMEDQLYLRPKVPFGE